MISYQLLPPPESSHVANPLSALPRIAGHQKTGLWSNVDEKKATRDLPGNHPINVPLPQYHQRCYAWPHPLITAPLDIAREKNLGWVLSRGHNAPRMLRLSLTQMYSPPYSSRPPRDGMIDTATHN